MADVDACNLTENEVKILADRLPIEEVLQDLSDFLKVFGDPTRIRILFLLRDRELCVQDICAVLNMQQAAISHQLKLLRQARLARYRREGKMVFYTLNDNHIGAILNLGLEHVEE
ncbi:MAG: winged helix-turn-helix transcriptional regulator [Spirochaetales bacterium]|nr:winged helix-turn-helix transcriptional regulator [Spirochaetales bacterium]